MLQSKSINKRKMLMVSQFTFSSDNYCYAEFLKKLALQNGFEVQTFDCKKNYFFFGPKSSDQLFWPFKAVCDLIANLNLLGKSLRFGPEILFLVKGENINFRLLKLLKYLQGCKLINFYPDSPFSCFNANSSYNVMRSLPLYDRFAIWSRLLAKVLVGSGLTEVFYWPFLCDPELFYPARSAASTEQKRLYESEVCFVGSWEVKRGNYLTELIMREPQLKLKIWGSGWQQNMAVSSVLQPSVQGKSLAPAQMRLAFSGAKIVLNFLRAQNATAHNMRTFEVTSCGAFLLAERSQEQAEELFTEGKTIACFANPDELHKKVILYLTMDNLRCKIAAAGLERAQLVLKSGELFKQLTTV